jgi:hypothetical protein
VPKANRSYWLILRALLADSDRERRTLLDALAAEFRRLVRTEDTDEARIAATVGRWAAAALARGRGGVTCIG